MNILNRNLDPSLVQIDDLRLPPAPPACIDDLCLPPTCPAREEYYDAPHVHLLRSALECIVERGEAVIDSANSQTVLKLLSITAKYLLEAHGGDMDDTEIAEFESVL